VKIRTLCVAAVAATLSACAVRLGGPSPEEYQALALIATETDTPAQVAERIASVGADLVLLSAPATRDSAWFAEIATAAVLQQSGPGRTGDRALGFLTNNLELLGDTSIVLGAGEGRLHMHDALYQIDDYRYLDLLAVRIEPGTEVRPAVRALTSYIATDVMSNAAVALAIDAPDVEAGDSIAALLQPLFSDARACLPRRSNGDRTRARVRVHLFHGPEARIGCEGASLVESDIPSLIARLIVNR